MAKFPLPAPMRFAFLMIASIGLGCISHSRAENSLSNPGFELDPAGENQTISLWQSYGQNVFSESDAAIAHSGTNYLKVFQAFSGADNFSGAYQDYISAPGAVYSADGWV